MIAHCAASLAVAALLFQPIQAVAADAATPGITLSHQSADQWRASKLVGTSIYGPDNRSVGKIVDVLVGRDGHAEDVIVGVGGFLGIGEKDVALPFGAVSFTDQPMATAQTAVPADNLAATPNAPAQGTTGTMPAATPGLGLPPATPGPGTMAPVGAPGAAAVPPHSTAYPDHGTIAFTADQLKSAPAFTFAP